MEFLDGFKPRRFLLSSCEVGMSGFTLVLRQPHAMQSSHWLLPRAVFLLTFILAQLKDRNNFIADNSLTV